jgi:menaquinone-dependent protoporphyrinogen oxidase
MKIAIVYASKYGTTESVVRSMAEKLLVSNQVQLFSLKDHTNPDINDFDWVILGSSIYAGQASKKMKSFCQKNESVLTQKKLGLFVCGMHIDAGHREKELKDAYPEGLWNKASVTSFLGGAFLFEKMNYIERLIIKKISKVDKTVHHILWNVVDEFVDVLQN